MSDRAIFWRVYPKGGGERVINMDHVVEVLFKKPLEEMCEEPWYSEIVITLVSGDQVVLSDSRQKREMVEDILSKASKPAKYFDEDPRPTNAVVHKRTKRLDGEGRRVRPGETSYLVEEFSATPAELAKRMSRYGGEGFELVSVEDKYLLEDQEESGLSESKYFWRLIMSKTLVREY